MPRPKVRHCKDCPHLKIYGGLLPIVSQVHHTYMCDRNGEYINGQEVRTSPHWCPLYRWLS